MSIDCSNCGHFEIGPKLCDELQLLPKNHWQINRIREAMPQVRGPKMITRDSTNIAEVKSISSDKLSKLQKKALRSKAEGKSTYIGRIIYTGKME